MKKLKLSSLQIGARELLTREQMKTTLGGSGGSGGSACTSNSDCSSHQACLGLGSLPKICVDIAMGTSCVTDSDCGNNQKCKPKGAPFTGNWCVNIAP